MMREAFAALYVILVFNALFSFNAYVFHTLGPEFEWWKGSILICSMSISIWAFVVALQFARWWRWK